MGTWTGVFINLYTMSIFSLSICAYLFFRLLKFKEAGPKPEVGELRLKFGFLSTTLASIPDPLLDESDNFLFLLLKTIEVT